MDIDAELENFENILDDIDRFYFYDYDIDFEIEYDQWNNDQKQQFVDEVSAFIRKKYNVDILEIFPQIQTIGGIYQDVIHNLEYDNIKYNSITSIANDINLIYIDIRNEIKDERINLFDEYLNELNSKLKLLKAKPYIYPGEFRANINIVPRKNKDYDIYISAYEYAIDILNDDYGYDGDDLSDIIENAINEYDETVIIKIYDILSDICNKLQQDISYINDWNDKLEKVFG